MLRMTISIEGKRTEHLLAAINEIHSWLTGKQSLDGLTQSRTIRDHKGNVDGRYSFLVNGKPISYHIELGKEDGSIEGGTEFEADGEIHHHPGTHTSRGHCIVSALDVMTQIKAVGNPNKIIALHVKDNEGNLVCTIEV